MNTVSSQHQESLASAANVVETLTGSTLSGKKGVILASGDPLRPSTGFLSDFQPNFTSGSTSLHKRSLLHKDDRGLSIYQVAGYYPLLRALGYFWEAKVTDFQSKLENKLSKADHKSSPLVKLLANNSNVDEKYANGQIKSLSNLFKEKIVSNDSLEVFTSSTTRAKAIINFAEAATFSAFAITSLHFERRQLHELTDMAARAETGHPHGKLTVSDLQKCQNPLVASALGRYTRRRNMHAFAGPGFIFGSQTGILLNAAVITAERMALSPVIAIDILKKSFDEVQLYEMSDALAKGQLINNLEHVLQQARIDHGRETIPPEQMQALVPVLSVIAQDAIEKKIGFNEAVYVMGGGLLIPGNPQQSMQNYRHFQQVGIDGVTFENKAKRDNEPHLQRSGWVGQVAGQKGRPQPDSTKPEALRRRHAEVIARDPTHLGMGGDAAGRTRGTLAI